MAIKQFDRPTLQVLGADIDAALASVAKKHGISIKRGRGTFTSQNFSLKLECVLLTETGEAITKEAQDFRRYAVSFGLKPEDFGKTFTFRGESYTVSGLKVKSRKFPILAKRSDGRIFKFTPDDVRRWLATVT